MAGAAGQVGGWLAHLCFPRSERPSQMWCGMVRPMPGPACLWARKVSVVEVPILVSDIVMETDDLPRQAQAKHENTVGN